VRSIRRCRRSLGDLGWTTVETERGLWSLAYPRECLGDRGGRESHASLLDLVAGIFAERFVLCEDVGREGDGSSTILDLTVRTAILEELTRSTPWARKIALLTGKPIVPSM